MLKTIHSLCFTSVFSKRCESKTTWIKSRQYTKLLDLVKPDEPKRNSIQAQEKASKVWNDVEEVLPIIRSYVIVKLKKKNIFKKVKKCYCLEKLCQYNTKNYHKQKSIKIVLVS